MLEAVGRNGYRATTVADVIVGAGVSRKTFYKHFANKQECFLAAYDVVSADAIRRVERVYLETEGWPERVEAAIRALFDAAIEHPAALRLATVEIDALGAAGVERREQAIWRYQRFITDAARLAPGGGGIPEAVARAIVGGFNRVLYQRVSSGRHVELLDLVPDLVSWAASYHPSPPAIARRRAGRGGSLARLEGGRAPGSLAPRGPSGTRRGLARGNRNVSRSFVVHSQRERILDAVANLVAANGYAAVSIDEIANEAAVSLHAFYEHFADKEDAMLVTYELGHAKGLAIVQQAFAAHDSWPQAVHAAIAALFHFLASEPAFAHIALVDAMTATARTAERCNTGVRAFAQMLIPGLDEVPAAARPPAVTIEAVAGGIFEICLRHAELRRIQELPGSTALATYLALAPFLGGDEAARIAAQAPPNRAMRS